MQKIVAIMGKAGSGKDTIVKKLIKTYPNRFNPIVSCTTRPRREGEQDKIDYYFLSNEQFADKVLNGDMLEACSFNGWHYGTMRSSLSNNKINIGVFSPDGIRCLIENPDIYLYIYYITASDKERLLRQLNRERNPNVDEIVRRYKTDQQDFAHLDDIPYIECNNETDKDLKVLIEYFK